MSAAAGTNISVYLLRHGQVEGPAALYGSTDIALSKVGWQQMQSQTNQLAVEQVISSPLNRCCSFASDLAARSKLAFQVNSDLRECHFGDWDGVPYDDISEQDWPQLSQFWACPCEHGLTNAEPLGVMYKRVVDAWQNIVSELAGNTLIITHGGVIRLILAYLLGLDWRNPKLFSQLRIGYASISKIEVSHHPDMAPVVSYIGALDSAKGTLGVIND